VEHKPAPAASLQRGRVLREFSLEICEAPKRLLYSVCQLAVRLSATALFHAVPEHGMVVVAPAVEVDCAPCIFRNGINVLQYVNNIVLVLPLWAKAAERLVEAVGVRLVVLCV